MLGQQCGKQEPAEVDDSTQLPVQDGLEQKVADDEKGTQSEGQVEDVADVESHVYSICCIFFPVIHIQIGILGFWDCPYVDSRFVSHRTAICYFEKKNTRTAPPYRTNVGQTHHNGSHRTTA
jgi:hypothetical protein